MFVVGDVADELFAVACIGPQPLLPPAGIARDHRVGGRQDGLGGAVVLLQQDRGGVGKVPFEVLDIADRRSAERVDGLVGVADNTELGRRNRIGVRSGDTGQLTDQHVLGVVGVLILVDEDVPETPAVVLGDLRVPLQHRHRLPDQVVEIQRVRAAQASLILTENLGHDAGQVIGTSPGRPRPVPGDQFVLRFEMALDNNLGVYRLTSMPISRPIISSRRRESSAS